MSIISRHARKSTRPATIRQTPASFAAGLLPAESVEDTWGDRFDASHRRFRQSRKPVAVLVEADPLPMVASPINGIGDMNDENFYQRFTWSPELSARRLAVVKASVDRIAAELDARDDSDIPAEEPTSFEDDPAWEDRWTVEAPAPLTVEELTKGVPHYGENGPASRRANADDLASAWFNGFKLGESGFEVDEICPPQSYTADEANEFITGVEAGSAERWAEYGRHLDELADRERTMEALHDDHEEREYAEARMTLAGCGCN